MPDSTTPMTSAEHYLHAQQADFVERFIRPGSAPHHQLVAPVGAGKTFVALEIVRRAAIDNAARRILIITPFLALRDQWVHRLRILNLPMLVTDIDRTRFREMESGVPIGESIWSSEVIAVMGAGVLAHEDVVRSLRAAVWDLVVVDESHALSQPAVNAVNGLVESGSVKRVLSMTATPRYESPSLPASETTDWRPSFGALLAQQAGIRVSQVNYERKSDEIEVLKQLTALFELLESGSRESGLKGILTRRAASSVFTLEKSLARLRNGIAHAVEVASTEDAESESDLDEPLRPQPAWSNPAEAFLQLERLLASLDSIQTDAKLDAADAIIRRDADGGRGERRICVITAFADTANYLRSALAARDIIVWKAIGGMSPEDRMAQIDQFIQQGGVLVATDAALQGVELSVVDAVVYYDPVRTSQANQARLGRFLRINRTRRLDVFLLSDSSNALPAVNEGFDPAACDMTTS